MRHVAWLLAASVIALSACSPQQAAAPTAAAPERPEVAAVTAPTVAVAPAADQGPPTVNGIYIDAGACPGEGCYLKGKIKAYEAVDLFDKAGSTVAIGKVAAGDWVDIIATENRLVPLRGVVSEGRKALKTGEAVYLLTSQGEGCYDIWATGKRASWCDPESVGNPETDDLIAWETSPVVIDMSHVLGLWVQVKRADGSQGWLHDVREFGCTGYQDRDTDCPALPQ